MDKIFICKKLFNIKEKNHSYVWKIETKMKWVVLCISITFLQNKRLDRFLEMMTAKDIGALACASNTCNNVPDTVKDIIAEYTKSLYVTEQRKRSLAQLAEMCVYVVTNKAFDKIDKARQMLNDAKWLYENAVRHTEKLHYENKGQNACLRVRRHTEKTGAKCSHCGRRWLWCWGRWRIQVEDDRYQEYLHEAHYYNNMICEKEELLRRSTAGGYYEKEFCKEIIKDKVQERIFIAEAWTTKREIDDGLWEPVRSAVGAALWGLS